MKRNTICLVMICRNEENFIVPALQSVERYIDHAIILDSQSDDLTLELIEAWKEHNPNIVCEVHQFTEPFRGDTKRTRAIELAKGKADYLLVMDADNTLEIIPLTTMDAAQCIKDGWPFMALSADAYLINKKMGDIIYPIFCLFRGDIDWKYSGVIHDFPHRADDKDFSQALLQGVIIHEPVKSATGDRAKKPEDFYHDALKIENEIFSCRSLSPLMAARYTFYLAQSYRDAGMTDRALVSYRARAGMGGWEEEVFYSYLSIARILQGGEAPVMEVMNAALKAWNYRPQRLEAAYLLMQLFMNRAMPRAALAIGRYSNDLAGGRDDKLFVEIDTYDTLFPSLLDNLEINSLEISK